MFEDGRSRRVIFLAHCILNQNAISDGTADDQGCLEAAVARLAASGVGMAQLPCPELLCLGLDRGNPQGARSPVTVENTRIRAELEREAVAPRLEALTEMVVRQIREYRRHGFEVLGLVGMNRSPSCGVETTSQNNMEVEGEGVFIQQLRQVLDQEKMPVRMMGIKGRSPQEAVAALASWLDNE